MRWVRGIVGVAFVLVTLNACGGDECLDDQGNDVCEVAQSAQAVQGVPRPCYVLPDGTCIDFWGPQPPILKP